MALVVKSLPAKAGDLKMRVRPLGWEDPLEEGMQPTPVFLPGEFHEQSGLVGPSPWGRKESDMTKQLTHTHTHTNQKRMEIETYF